MTRPFLESMDGATCLSLLNDLYELAQAGGLVVDTDGTLAANSDVRIASQKAVKTYADALIAANDAMVFKGVIDCSTTPNYPAADRGHTYRASVAGKIGGAAGINVEVGDMFICLTDGTLAGTQAGVGASWSIIQANLDGALISGGALGTPSAGNLSNCTAFPLASLTGAGANVLAALAIAVGTAGGPVTNGGALGTPSGGTLTSCTGLPVSTGISGLGSGVAAFLATPSSANFAAAINDEIGTGKVVLNANPIFDTAVYLPIPAPAALGAASTATAAQMIAGLLQYTGAVGTLTLDTGTNIDTAAPAALTNNHGFEFSIINTGSGVCTVTTATGLTLVGTMTLAAGVSGRFSARRTAANTYSIYRLS